MLGGRAVHLIQLQLQRQACKGLPVAEVTGPCSAAEGTKEDPKQGHVHFLG